MGAGAHGVGGGGDQDAALPALHHLGHDRPAGQRHAFDVDVEHPIPVFRCDREVLGRSQRAGVGEEEVDGPQRGLCAGHCGFDLGRIGNVNSVAYGAAAKRSDLSRYSRRRVAVDIGDRHRRAVVRHLPGQAAANAAAGAGDECDFAAEIDGDFRHVWSRIGVF